MPFPNPKTSSSPIDNVMMEVISVEAFFTSVDLKLFDKLESGPLTADELASSLGVEAKPLGALLDILVNKEFLNKDADGYGNTAMAQEYLLSSSPLYQGTFVLAQRKLNENVRTNMLPMLKGESSEREKTDDSWAESETMNATLQHALNGQIQDAVDYLSALEGFQAFERMADIGGNHGQYSMELLNNNPGLQSTIYDLPNVTEIAAQRCRTMGYDKRIACEPFNILTDKLPADTYDLIFTSHILYGCLDRLDDVLATLYDALAPGGYFASHHFHPESGTSLDYKASIDFLTKLMGYETHFITRELLETGMAKAGFTGIQQTFTGADKQTLLLVGRKG